MRRLASLNILSTSAAVLALGAGNLLAQAANSDRPNILIILTDDQSPETLGAYGNTVCQTPNIDRLAREGMLFHNAHHMGSWSGAVCLPSRTMIMTGRHVWDLPNRGRGRNRKRGVAGAPEPPYDPAQSSMPAIFNRAGYATFRTCKIGNSYGAANRLFAEVHDAVKRGGSAAGGSAWHADRVLEFLDRRGEGANDEPFLIYFGLSHPHDARNGPTELVASYGADNKAPPATPNPKSPPLPANWLPEHPFHHGHPDLRDEVSVQGVGRRRDEATVRNEMGREYACIQNIDIQVGRVIAKLTAIGELDNTYIFFASDHGIAVGRHGLMGKQNLYEHTWRVPFVVRGPGIKPGTETPAMIYLSDLLPTICDLAGVDKPEAIQTESIAPILRGQTDKGRPHVYGVYSGGTKPGMRAIKTGRFKLIKYDALDGKVRETQLFDLVRNPREFLKQHHAKAVTSLTGNTPKPNQVNLADDPAHAQIRAELESLLLAEMKRLGDPNRLWDQPQPPRVLLIGDSISIGYTEPVRRLLIGTAEVRRPNTNCGPTTKGLADIDEWLGKENWDVIHFNWGLHDLKYIAADGKRVAPSEGAIQVPIDQYEQNLRRLVARLKKTGATLIWCSTTPVPAGAVGRIAGDAARYNDVAREVMEDEGIVINDLFAFAKPQLDKIQKSKDVHFTPRGSRALARQVTTAIEAAIEASLDSKRHNGNPDLCR